DERGGGVTALEAGHQGQFAAADGRDQARLVNGRYLSVAALDERLDGDVADDAIAVGGQDGDLLLHTGQRDGRVLGQHVDALDTRTIEIELDTLGDPQAE